MPWDAPSPDPQRKLRSPTSLDTAEATATVTKEPDPLNLVSEDNELHSGAATKMPCDRPNCTRY